MHLTLDSQSSRRWSHLRRSLREGLKECLHPIHSAPPEPEGSHTCQGLPVAGSLPRSPTTFRIKLESRGTGPASLVYAFASGPTKLCAVVSASQEALCSSSTNQLPNSNSVNKTRLTCPVKFYPHTCCHACCFDASSLHPKAAPCTGLQYVSQR